MFDFRVDIFRPPLGSAAAVLLLALAAAVTVWATIAAWRSNRRANESAPVILSIFRQAILLTLRLMTLLVSAWLLAGPSRFSAAPATAARPSMVFLADTSSSMNVADIPKVSAGPTSNGNQTQPALTTRWNAIAGRWLDPEYLTALEHGAHVQIIGFDNDVRTLLGDEVGSLVPAGKATNLLAAVTKVVPASPVQSGILVVLSDGHDTSGRTMDPAWRDQLRNSGWRIMAVPVGSALSGRQVKLSAYADADTVMSGQSTSIHATIYQSGVSASPAPVAVDLLQDGRRIGQREVEYNEDAAAQVVFDVKPRSQAGEPVTLNAYQVSVHSPDRTTDAADSSRWIFIQSRRDRIRVALFEGEPYWDSQFLVQVLRDDAQIDLTTVYALSPNRTITTSSRSEPDDHGDQLASPGGNAKTALPDPITPTALNEFDVVILGRGAELFFGGERAQMLVDYVRQRGGALVLARGLAFDPASQSGRRAQKIFAEIEPVEWGRQTLGTMGLHVTEAGAASPLLHFESLGSMGAIISRLPDMLAATQVRRDKAASIILLRQSERDNVPGGTPNSMAALAYQRVDRGQVLAVLTDGLWRWAFLPSRLHEFDSVYQMLWARAIRWLAGGGEFLPGQAVSLTLDRLTAEPDQPVRVIVATRYVEPDRFHPSLRLISPDGQVQAVPLTHAADQSPRYEATVSAGTPGVYELELLAPGMQPQRLTSRLAVYDRAEETQDTSAQPQILEGLCRATGGEVLGLNQTDKLLQIVSQWAAANVPDRKVDYVFDQPAVLAALALLLGTEWLFRRLWGGQ